MKNPIDISTHAAIMEWGKAYFDGDKEKAQTELCGVAQKLGELGITSDEIDQERTRRAQERIARLHTPDASREINRSYLLLRDMVALDEDRPDPMEAMYRHPRSDLLPPEAPVLTVVADAEQAASTIAA